MKITNLRTRVVSLPLDPASGAGYGKQQSIGCVLVYLQSDEGPVGQGLLSSLNSKRLKILAELVESLAPLAVGLDPNLSGLFLTRAAADLRSTGTQGAAALAVGAIESAMWDLRGKAAHLNVSALLGAYRLSVPVYQSSGLWVDRSIDQLQRTAQGHIRAGYRAMKMRLTGDLAKDVSRVQAVREAIGPDIALLADANQKMTAPQAIRLGRRLEPFGLEWLEDPVAAHDVHGSAAVASALDLPIASGENACLSREADQLLESRAVDVLMIDLQRIGGPSEFLKSAHLAEAARLPFASHLFSEMSLALLAAIPNALWLESMPWHSALYREAIKLDDSGCAVVSDRPGWGFEFDEDVADRFALK